MAGAGIDWSLAALGLSISMVAAATVPLAAVWVFLSTALGHAQRRRQVEGDEAAGGDVDEDAAVVGAGA